MLFTKPDTFHEIRFAPDPERHLASYRAAQFEQPIEARTYQTLLAEDELAKALKAHTSWQDVPYNSDEAFHGLARELRRRGRLHQFTLRFARRGEMQIREDVLPTALVAGRFTLASALGFSSHGPVTTAIEQGYVDVIELRRSPASPRAIGVERYVVCGDRGGAPDRRFAAWLELHERWCDLHDLAASQIKLARSTVYHSVSHVAAAAQEGELPHRLTEDGRLELYVGWDYLHWILSRREKVRANWSPRLRGQGQEA